LESLPQIEYNLKSLNKLYLLFSVGKATMKHLLFIIILLSLSGCGGIKDNKPADLIPEEKMIEILTDIHIADAVVEQKYTTQKPDLPLTNALYTRIYKNYGITAARYKSSYKYYEAHPALMDKIYTQVITELSKKEALLNK
jgi:hypothetical protein